MSAKPRRFYTSVSLVDRDGGRAVALDGRVARTAGRRELVAAAGLAEALREEWDAQAEVIDLARMPLTRLHGFVLDAGEAGRSEFAETVIQYAGSDLLCYRAEDGKLAAEQDRAFGPFLEWARRDGLAFVLTEGVFPVEQPAEIAERLGIRLHAMTSEELFARKLLTEILGSAILALYADEAPDDAFAAARLDETFQADAWGRDAEAEARERLLRRDFDDVLRYLALALPR